MGKYLHRIFRVVEIWFLNRTFNTFCYVLSAWFLSYPDWSPSFWILILQRIDWAYFFKPVLPTFKNYPFLAQCTFIFGTDWITQKHGSTVETIVSRRSSEVGAQIASFLLSNGNLANPTHLACPASMVTIISIMFNSMMVKSVNHPAQAVSFEIAEWPISLVIAKAMITDK